MTEPAPPSNLAADPSDDLFLTPRVIDRRAFDEYSSLLRGLIREAAGESRTLRAAAGEVKGVQEGLERAAADLKVRLEAVVKVLPTLEQRIARTEALLAATADSSRLHDELTRQVASAARAASDQAVADLRQQAADLARTILQDFARQIEELSRQARDELVAACDRARQELDDTARQARREIDSAGAEALQRLADGARDENLASSRAADVVRAAETDLARRLAEVRASMDQAAERARHAALQAEEASRSRLEQALARASQNADELLASLDTRLASVHEWASRVVAELDARLDAWRKRTADITATLGPAALATVENLPLLLNEARHERQALEDAIRAGADRIEGQSAALERLAARHAELSAQIAESIARTEHTAPKSPAKRRG